jgi:DNA-binding beta-propeller fold protein YncE
MSACTSRDRGCCSARCATCDEVAVTPTARPPLCPDSPGNSVSPIDVKTRTKHPTDIAVGSFPFVVAFTPVGKTAFSDQNGGNTVSTIDVKTIKRILPTSLSARPHRGGGHAVSPGDERLMTFSEFMLIGCGTNSAD